MFTLSNPIKLQILLLLLSNKDAANLPMQI